MKKSSRILIGGLLIALGCGCFLYPNLRELNTQREVNEIINVFSETFDDIPDDGSKDCLNNGSSESDNAGESAIAPEETPNKEASADTDNKQRPYESLYNDMLEYNRNLYENGQHIVDAWSYEQEPFQLSLIDEDNSTIGYIEVPDMDIRLPLMLGASTENLKKGAAVLSETSMPIGGDNTNCVIAAHRGWEGSAYFQFVENMEIGSKVYITNPWETLVYECTGTKIIYPDDVSSILIQDGKDMITLFTCHPYMLGGGPYRYLVFCERVDTLERKSNTDINVVNPKTKNNQPIEKTEITQPAESALSEAQIKSESKIDWIALERTLRIMLPIAIVAFTLTILLTRALSTLTKTKRKRKLKKRRKDI